MDHRFLPHNQHWQSPRDFASLDPNLRLLSRLPLVHEPSLLQRLPADVPGIYILTGGRQIGKTTLLKQWMWQLLRRHVPPKSIAYVTGEMIDDHHALLNALLSLREEMPAEGVRYLLIDEVTYIRDWDKALKFMADSGQAERTVILLTGSDTMLIRQARSRFPGRRGAADRVDFHLYPLSFREAVLLKYGEEETAGWMRQNAHAFLTRELMAYLAHGGYLTAINDMAEHRRILPATLRTYADWIRGDMLKHGKQEHYLREVLTAIARRYGSQVTWNALSRDLSIDHPKTVADYVELLASMDAVFVQPALNMDKLAAAPKKARKLMFTDPFIFHAVRAWLEHSGDPYAGQIQPTLADAEWQGRLIEATVANHFSCLHPTYYIKTDRGEVDVATVRDGRVQAIEVKWTSQLRTKDLKIIGRMNHGKVWANVAQAHEMNGLAIEPLPQALFDLA